MCMVTIIKAWFPLKLCTFIISVSPSTSMRLLTAQMYVSLIKKRPGIKFSLAMYFCSRCACENKMLLKCMQRVGQSVMLG